MTNEEINIAIAESCGWKRETRKMYGGVKNVKGWGLNTHLSLGSPDRYFVSSPLSLPNYCEDIYAVMGAVKSLPYELQPVYMNILTNPVLMKEEGVSDFERHNASAYHRAVALVRTIGKWHAPETKKEGV